MSIHNTPADFDGIRDEIVRLRCLGYGKERIAKSMQLSVARVTSILKSEFVDRFAARDELKQKTALELDWLLRPLQEKYEQFPTRQDAEVMLKIIDRRCKLFALDEAVKVEVKHIEDLSEDEIRRELERYGIKQLEQSKVPQLPPAVNREQIPDAEFTEKEHELPESL